MYGGVSSVSHEELIKIQSNQNSQRIMKYTVAVALTISLHFQTPEYIAYRIDVDIEWSMYNPK